MGAFHEVQFPTDISYGSRGGPGFGTSVVEVDSGQEYRVARRDQEQNRYDVSYGVKSYDQLAALLNFYRARKGCATGFRFKDWTDFTSNPTNPGYRSSAGTADQTIGTGDGSTTTFQLVKVYTSGPGTHTRVITKPVSGTVRVWVNGVEKTIVTDFNVDYTTGVVSMTSAPAAGHLVKASFQFDVPVRFGREVDEALAVSIDEFDSGGIDSVPLVEDMVPDPGSINEFFYGGAYEGTVGAGGYTLSTGVARVFNLSATVSSANVSLPNPSSIPPGGPIFYLRNGGGSNNLVLKNDTGSTIATLTPGTGVEVLLTITSGGAKYWEAQ